MTITSRETTLTMWLHRTLPAHGQQTLLNRVSLSLGQAESPGEVVDCLDERIHQQSVVL